MVRERASSRAIHADWAGLPRLGRSVLAWRPAARRVSPPTAAGRRHVTIAFDLRLTRNGAVKDHDGGLAVNRFALSVRARRRRAVGWHVAEAGSLARDRTRVC